MSAPRLKEPTPPLHQMCSWNVDRQAVRESACLSVPFCSANITDHFKLIPFSEYVPSTYYVFGGAKGNDPWLLFCFCQVVPLWCK